MPKFEKRGGLVTVVTQDAENRQVLMVAYANREAYLATLRTRKATYWSTSRNKLWVKGEESGNTQEVTDVLVDCDGDALIYLVRQTGSGACHTGAESCFYRSCVEARQVTDAPKAGEKESLSVVLLSDADLSVTVADAERLRVLLPTGSLSVKMKTYLGKVGYRMKERDRTGYCGSVGSIDFFERDRRMIPRLLGGHFDVGVTGKDLVVASGVQDLRCVAELPFSRGSDQPTRWVLAAARDVRTMQRIRVGCELPGLARMLLPLVPGLPAFDIVHIEGSEETAISDGLCDAVLVVTESGDSLKANGLRIVGGADNLLLSYPQIVAAPLLSAAKEALLQQVHSALLAAVGAESHVLITFDILQRDLEGLVLPAAVSPTVSKLLQKDWVAAQVCVERASIGSILAQVRSAGAKAIAIVELIGWLP